MGIRVGEICISGPFGGLSEALGFNSATSRLARIAKHAANRAIDFHRVFVKLNEGGLIESSIEL